MPASTTPTEIITLDGLQQLTGPELLAVAEKVGFPQNREHPQANDLNQVIGAAVSGFVEKAVLSTGLQLVSSSDGLPVFSLMPDGSYWVYLEPAKAKQSGPVVEVLGNVPFEIQSHGLEKGLWFKAPSIQECLADFSPATPEINYGVIPASDLCHWPAAEVLGLMQSLHDQAQEMRIVVESLVIDTARELVGETDCKLNWGESIEQALTNSYFRVIITPHEGAADLDEDLLARLESQEGVAVVSSSVQMIEIRISRAKVIKKSSLSQKIRALIDAAQE